MTENPSSVVKVSEFTGVLRRGAKLVAASALVGALVGTGLLATQTRLYVSDAVIEVRPIVSRQDDPNLDVSRQVDTATEVVVARSLRVAERALALRQAGEQLGTTDYRSADVMALAATLTVDPDGARKALTGLEASVVGDSTILRFQAAGADAGRAQALAQSSAVAYLEFRRSDAAAGGEASRQRLEAREQQLVSDLNALDAAAPVAPAEGADGAGADGAGADGAGVDAPATAELAYEAIAKRQELVSIGSKYANLEALAVDPGVVLTDAFLPTSTEGLPLYAGPMMGAMLGLIGALTAIFVLDRNDDRLRSGRVELSALGVPVLGNAPVAVSRGLASGGVATGGEVYAVNSPGGDAYRRLQGSLVFNLDNESKSVVLVAGVTSSTAATTVAANVAVTAARSGRRTLVIGADLRQNQLAARFNMPPSKGLSDVVLSGASLAESIRSVPWVENLSVLSAGTRLDRPADVLQSEALARLLAAVEADFDLVIVEAAPILEVADAVDVAPLCHGSVVVVEAATETRAAIADSVNQLRGVGSDVVGVVVADAR